jgi:hypothetical protein
MPQITKLGDVEGLLDTDDEAWPLPSLRNGYEQGTERPDDTTGDYQPNRSGAESLPPEPSIAATAAGDMPIPPYGARPPLPERQPQQHLAPELRDGNLAGLESAEPARSPEEIRERFALYQRGWRAGRVHDNAETTSIDHDRNA